MKLILATLPDDTAQQARWLEEHLLGLDLAGIVAELKALRGRRQTPELSLEETLGDSLPAILEKGLSSLPPEPLRALLKHPELLIQLQTRIFLEGGEYWNQLPEPPAEVSQSVARGQQQLQLFLATQSQSLLPAAQEQGISTEAGSDHHRRSVAWYRRPFVVSLATAACVLAAVFIIRPFSPVAPAPVAQGWGWSKPGAIDDTLSPKAYLTSLSTAADDWFLQRPATAAALSKRLLEFRQGCSTLILSEHRPLSSEDKAWLIERCQTWAKKLDQHLADVEAGKDLLQVRSEADETVNKLRKALGDRAATA